MKITIITVVLNDEVHIQKTIESVINQSWRDLEYLIIDGGSTDHTLSIIEKFRSKIQYLISEPDSGIYDAMNKGIRLANGKFTHFMNSGDTFDNPQVIHQIFSTIKSPKGIIYGDTRYQYPDGNTRIVRAHSEENIWKPFFNHQAAFFQTDILKETGFNSLYRPASDFHLVMKSRSDGIELQYIPKIINTFLIGGDIYQQEFKTIRLYGKINRKFNNSPYTRLYYYRKTLWIGFTSLILKPLLPEIIYFKIHRIFRRIFPES